MDSTIVQVRCRYLQDVYESEYLGDVCCGEMLRNCCVNLCIDPDMSDGLVHNVEVYLSTTDTFDDASLTLWSYLPSRSIGKCCCEDSHGRLFVNILLKMK